MNYIYYMLNRIIDKKFRKDMDRSTVYSLCMQDRNEGISKGKEIGKVKGKVELLTILVRNGCITDAIADKYAKDVGYTLGTIKNNAEYGSIEERLGLDLSFMHKED